MQPLLVQFRLCHPGEGHTGRGRRKKNKTHAVVTQGDRRALVGGSTTPGTAEGCVGSAPGGRAKLGARLAQSSASVSAGAAAWLRPSAAANCKIQVSTATAATGRARRGRGPPAASGRARSAALGPRPDVSAPRSAPGVWGTRGRRCRSRMGAPGVRVISGELGGWVGGARGLDKTRRRLSSEQRCQQKGPLAECGTPARVLTRRLRPPSIPSAF